MVKLRQRILFLTQEYQLVNTVRRVALNIITICVLNFILFIKSGHFIWLIKPLII